MQSLFFQDNVIYMPAKGLHRTSQEGSFSHVYNKGVEGRAIFNNIQDYETFLAYLKDYLTTPLDSESSKKTFTVRGHSFRGTPHQPKNYFGKIELLAYRLSPDSFHLVLHQKNPGSVEGFIRSLCTRYSLYYNKRYQRRGSLFEGPYKSVQVADESLLMLLTYFLHRDSEEDSSNIRAYSSYPEYIGKRKSSWLNTDIVLSSTNAKGYQNYVEKYQINQEEAELLEGIKLENAQLERRDVQSIPVDAPKENIVVKHKRPSRTPEITGMVLMFFLLFGIGYRNVSVSKVQGMAIVPSSQPEELSAPDSSQSAVLSAPDSSQSAVLSASDSAQPQKAPKPKMMLVVKNAAENSTVPIHLNPSADSQKVGYAKNKDVFEFVGVNSGWFGVKLADGSTGYIFSDFIDIIESNP